MEWNRGWAGTVVDQVEPRGSSLSVGLSMLAGGGLFTVAQSRAQCAFGCAVVFVRAVVAVYIVDFMDGS
ncbi:MAG TPA: hypothetical protein VFQ91_23715 [Bryobacteraceae bacterium]|nr:hypothetical protein [Bryobacteraceae bacterium]